MESYLIMLGAGGILAAVAFGLLAWEQVRTARMIRRRVKILDRLAWLEKMDRLVLAVEDQAAEDEKNAA